MSEYLFKTDKEIKTCNECPMSEQLKIEDCYYCNLLHDIAENNTKNSDCPLVEVPTHGRLIVADELLKKVRDEAEFPSEEWCKVIECIENAQTIIEASEERECQK